MDKNHHGVFPSVDDMSGNNEMKVVILAGGLGTRISEETTTKPKPMVEIGGMPILWHIMKIYSHHGFNDFIICLGYKGYMIKEFFANYFLHMADITIDMKKNRTEVHQAYSEPWKVTLIDTGPDTMTGGRIKRVQGYTDNKTFMCTYGDGVANINISELVKFHKGHKKTATLTAVSHPGRGGVWNKPLKIGNGKDVKDCMDRPSAERGFVNGGFFVLEQNVFDHLNGDGTVWEKTPLGRLAEKGELHAFFHNGFWQPLDTPRDMNYLNGLWSKGRAPWKCWK